MSNLYYLIGITSLVALSGIVFSISAILSFALLEWVYKKF